MYVQNFIEILNKTGTDKFEKLLFSNDTAEVFEVSFCTKCHCAGIRCQNCPFHDSKNFEKFKQELNEKVIPILKLQCLIEE